MKDGIPPSIKGEIYFMFFPRNGSAQTLVRFTVSCIKAVVTDHFKVFFRDMLCQTGNKVESRDCFSNEFVIFVAIVMKGDKIAGIRINAGGGNHWSSEIAADIFDDLRGITFIRHSTDIKTIFVIRINGCFHFFKRITNSGMQFIEKCSLE